MSKFIQGDSQSTDHHSRHDEHWCPLVSEKLATFKGLNMEKNKGKM
jgi:hypothetical protein